MIDAAAIQKSGSVHLAHASRPTIPVAGELLFDRSARSARNRGHYSIVCQTPHMIMIIIDMIMIVVKVIMILIIDNKIILTIDMIVNIITLSMALQEYSQEHGSGSVEEIRKKSKAFQLRGRSKNRRVSGSTPKTIEC